MKNITYIHKACVLLATLLGVVVLVGGSAFAQPTVKPIVKTLMQVKPNAVHLRTFI